MSNKIKIIIAFSVVLIVYSVSYGITLISFEKNSPNQMTINTHQDIVNKETKIILTNRYLKSGEETKEEISVDENLIGKGMDYARNYYKEKYSIINASSKEISLLKSYNTYSPSKYYLTLDDGKIAIYYIDSNLKVSKVKGTDILIELYNEEDKKTLEEGNILYQFNTLEEAEESLEDYI